MPKGIEKNDWDQVHELAIEIVKASGRDDEILADSRTAALLELLEEFREKYGEHPSLLATMGDYQEDFETRMRFYRKALRLAREQEYQEEIELIEESIRELEEDEASKE